MRSYLYTTVIVIAITLPGVVNGQGFIKKHFVDTLDNNVDVSEFLNSGWGFLPVAVPITEPAVGFGLAGGLAIFHDKASEIADDPTAQPDMSAVVGAYTANGTWLAAAYHQRSWFDDGLRANAAVAYVSVNLSFYPTENPTSADSSGGKDDGFAFNMKGLVFMPEVDVRLFGSKFFVGLDYTFFNNDVTFDFEDEIPEAPDDERETRLSGLGVALKYDGLDNTFTPNRGLKGELSYSRYDSLIGSTENFGAWTAKAIGFQDFADRWVPGLNVSAQGAGDGTPFYALPYVNLRGIPAMRYQGDLALSTEAELRANITRRWALVGFGGVGYTSIETILENQVTETVYTYGAGVRYLLARIVNLWAGFDVARGPEDTVFYIQVGKAMNW